MYIHIHIQHGLQCDKKYSVPSPWDNSQYITYAAKAHPELSPSSSLGQPLSLSLSSNTTDQGLGLVISLLSNPVKGPAQLFQPEQVHAYLPRFFVLPLSQEDSLCGN